MAIVVTIAITDITSITIIHNNSEKKTDNMLTHHRLLIPAHQCPRLLSMLGSTAAHAGGEA